MYVTDLKNLNNIKFNGLLPMTKYFSLKRTFSMTSMGETHLQMIKKEKRRGKKNI